MRILLIEDNDDHAEIIQDILENTYSDDLSIARSSYLLPGLDCLSNEVFDLCLCDLKLPDSTIENTIEVLSLTNLDTPIIVLTSINDDAIAIDLIKAGIQDFIAKDRLDSEYLYKQCQFSIERKATQKALQDKTADYEAFCHSLSHDFSGAIRRISQCSHLLSDSLFSHYSLSAQEKQWLDYIQVSATEVQKLTIDLYNYLSSDASQFDQVATDSELNELVELIVKSIDQPISILKCDLPALKGNSSQLQLALKNLIDNAVKYNKNPVEMRFSHEVDVVRNRIIMNIEDNGIGIPKEMTACIFAPFRRLENGLKRPGSGLGLSLVHRIFKHMGGSISVEPSSLGGTCFKIQLSGDLLSKH